MKDKAKNIAMVSPTSITHAFNNISKSSKSKRNTAACKMSNNKQDN